MIRSIGVMALAATLVIPLATPASAQRGHDWGGRSDRGGGRDYHRGGGGGGAAIGGALLGLGIGAVIGGAIASSQPAYRAPPPVYYAPQPPAPPPVYYGY
jgi:hypothetical protein